MDEKEKQKKKKRYNKRRIRQILRTISWSWCWIYFMFMYKKNCFVFVWYACCTRVLDLIRSLSKSQNIPLVGAGVGSSVGAGVGSVSVSKVVLFSYLWFKQMKCIRTICWGWSWIVRWRRRWIICWCWCRICIIGKNIHMCVCFRTKSTQILVGHIWYRLLEQALDLLKQQQKSKDFYLQASTLQVLRNY